MLAGDASALRAWEAEQGAVRRTLALLASVLVLAALGFGIYRVLFHRSALLPSGLDRAKKRRAAAVSPRSRRPRDLVFAFRAPAPLLAQVHWRLGAQPSSARERTITANLSRLAQAGFDTLVVDALDEGDGGTAYISKPSLAALGFRAGPALLPAILEAAHRRGLRTVADCSALARPTSGGRRRPARLPTAAELRSLVRALLGLGFDGVVARGLPSPLAALLRAEQPSGRVALWGRAPDDEILAGRPASGSGLGWIELDGSEPGAARNLALLRTVQHPLRGYLWRQQGARWASLPVALDELRDELLPLARQPHPRPLINVVLASDGSVVGQRAVRQLAGRVLRPLMTAALLAGFRVQASAHRPLAKAFGYIVLAVGRTPQLNAAAPAFLHDLLIRRRPLLLLVQGLSDVPSWRALWSRLGIKPSWRPAFTTASVDTVEFEGKTRRWASGTPLRTLLLPPAAVDGEVLVQAEVGGLGTVLALRRDRLVLVNASALAPESTFIINALLGATLVSPFRGEGTVGERSAFFAHAATTLAVRLPIAERVKLRLTRYGADGRRQTIEVFPYEAPLKTLLERHELMIVEPVAP